MRNDTARDGATLKNKLKGKTHTSDQSQSYKVNITNQSLKVIFLDTCKNVWISNKRKIKIKKSGK